MYDKLLEKLTGIVKKTFQSTGNLKESSLITIFERWSEKNKEKLNLSVGQRKIKKNLMEWY